MFLSYLIGKMHNELNKMKNSFINPFKSIFSSNIEDKSEIINIDLSDKKKAADLFISTFNKNNSSILSDNVYGIMKTKTVCEKCQTRTYTFESFYFIAFNLNLLQTKINNMNQISIYDCFTFQNNTLMKLPFFSK